MPKFDGTGPLGYGPGSGRGMGPCYAQRGFRRFYTKTEESEMLKEEIKDLEKEIKAMKERLSEIER